MSKQIYIDSNGNEIQVSGTVNTADMMPMSGNDSTKVSEAIGSLSTLTTTDKSSIVGAVNEVNSKIDFDTASGTVNINANNYADPVITVPVKSGYICRGVIGLYVGNTNIAVNAYYMTDSNTKVKIVLRNVTSTTQSGVDFTAVLLYVRN